MNFKIKDFWVGALLSINEYSPTFWNIIFPSS